MDFDIGSTGVADLHYSFGQSKKFDVVAERERIQRSNKALPHKTVWASKGEVQSKDKEAYEKRYVVYKRMRDEGYTLDDIATEIGLSKVTLSAENYRGRYQKENA